jgi:2'-5' RNA ligase
MQFLAENALYRSAPFEADAFTLFSSVITSDGSHYTPERVYPLRKEKP